jgi:xylose dehydrogenase (NAD/NADP)
MNSKKVKWGILDTANNTYEDLTKSVMLSANFEIYAIANDSEQTRNIAKKLQIPSYYKSLDELLKDPNIDAMYIPFVTDFHTEIIISAASAKKHIICKNSAVLNEQNVMKIINHCEKNNVFFIDAMYYSHSHLDKVKQLIQEESIGSIKMIRGSFSELNKNKDAIDSFNSPLKEGALCVLGSYCVDIINSLLDSDPISAVASGAINKHGIDTTVLAILNYPNQVHAVFDCSIEMNRQHQYEIIGTKGSMKLTFDGEAIIIQTNNTTKEITVNKNHFDYGSGCILHNITPTHSGRYILNNLRIIDSIYEALKQKSEIPIGKTDKRTEGWGEECGIAALLRR